MKTNEACKKIRYSKIIRYAQKGICKKNKVGYARKYFGNLFENLKIRAVTARRACQTSVLPYAQNG
jgi:hypothetical protein